MQMYGIINTQYLIKSSEIKGKSVYKIQNDENGNKFKNLENHVIVKKEPETGIWNIVDKLEKEIPYGELTSNYGLWEDKRRLSNLFLKKDKPETDEVIPLKTLLFKDKHYEGYEPFEIGDWMISGHRKYYSNVEYSKISVAQTKNGEEITLKIRSMIDDYSEELGYFCHK